MPIHNYEFGNYNEMEEGFGDVYGQDGGGDDADQCCGLPDRSGDGGSSLMRIPPPVPLRRLNFLDSFFDCGCFVRLLQN